MNTIHTLGYAAWTTDQLQALVEEENALLADVRLSPKSGKAGFSKHELAGLLGQRYVHVPAMGNANYQGGPIQIKDFDCGVQQLRRVFVERKVEALILMCGCQNAQTCHRRTVAERLAKKKGLDVEHLEPPVETTPGAIKAITIWQPFASLIMCGSKNFETRTWTTNYRGPLAIHSAKRWRKEQRNWTRSLHNIGHLDRTQETIARGCILGVCELVEVWPGEHPALDAMKSEYEDRFGDFSPGGYAWELEEVERFDEPIPYRGQQGLWDLDTDALPAGILD